MVILWIFVYLGTNFYPIHCHPYLPQKVKIVLLTFFFSTKSSREREDIGRFLFSTNSAIFFDLSRKSSTEDGSCVQSVLQTK
ncbi:hypothetical protein L1987_28580 [Smallanthus sonchifolius]|uniref:Uncharacterized protein n=1 Tax=Smallanthus sonchifolius TaxID=185202 RepID=A0ACB9HXI9_9ASTR|nr:hypothetical protein L1987_28580 [Smallanthus sonchifolius]